MQRKLTSSEVNRKTSADLSVFIADCICGDEMV